SRVPRRSPSRSPTTRSRFGGVIGSRSDVVWPSSLGAAGHRRNILTVTEQQEPPPGPRGPEGVLFFTLLRLPLQSAEQGLSHEVIVARSWVRPGTPRAMLFVSVNWASAVLLERVGG